MKDLSEVPNYLHSTYKMLLAAFPNGPSEDDYLALLSILAERMSQKALGDVIEDLGYCGKRSGYNDVLTAVSDQHRPCSESIEKARRHLQAYGFDAWLAENTD